MGRAKDRQGLASLTNDEPTEGLPESFCGLFWSGNLEMSDVNATQLSLPSDLRGDRTHLRVPPPNSGLQARHAASGLHPKQPPPMLRAPTQRRVSDLWSPTSHPQTCAPRRAASSLEIRTPATSLIVNPYILTSLLSFAASTPSLQTSTLHKSRVAECETF